MRVQCRYTARYIRGEMESAEQKTVLVSFGDSRRVITVPVPPSADTTLSEHDFVLNVCIAEFRDFLPEDLNAYTLSLQVKDEEWGGVFVDYKQQSVIDRAVFKLQTIPRMVRVCVYTILKIM